MSQAMFNIHFLNQKCIRLLKYCGNKNKRVDSIWKKQINYLYIHKTTKN